MGNASKVNENSNPKEVVQLQNVARIYGTVNLTHALPDISFKVDQGEFTAIVDPPVPEKRAFEPHRSIGYPFERNSKNRESRFQSWKTPDGRN